MSHGDTQFFPQTSPRWGEFSRCLEMGKSGQHGHVKPPPYLGLLTSLPPESPPSCGVS